MAAKKGKGPRPSVMGSSWSSGRPAGWQDDVLGGIRNIVDTATGRQRNPAEPEVVTRGRAATGAIVQAGAMGLDAYVTGGLAGSFYRNVAQPQAVVGSPDRRSREQREGLGRFGRDVAVTAATGGAVYGAARVAPKVFPALSREIGVHVSKGFGEGERVRPWKDLGRSLDTYHGRGPGEWVDVPANQTFKVSGRTTGKGAFSPGKPISPQRQSEYANWVYANPNDIAYVTSSRVGRADPNARFQTRVEGLGNDGPPLRMVPSQKVVGETRLTGDFRSDVSNLAAEISRQRQALDAARLVRDTRAGFAAGRTAVGSQVIGRPNRRGRNTR